MCGDRQVTKDNEASERESWEGRRAQDADEESDDDDDDLRQEWNASCE